MPDVMRLQTAALAVGSALFLMSVIAGCAPGGHAAPALPSPSILPWPPLPAQPRQATDDVIAFKGREFSQHGGGAAANGDHTDFTGGGALPWAIYALPGFSPAIEVAQVELDFMLTEGTPGDGTMLYVGLSDYSRGLWEWHAATPPTFSQAIADGSPYRSATGAVAIAVLLWGPGTASVSEVRYSRAGDTDLVAPANLAAQANFSHILLDWDDVGNTLGYNVYRALEPDFPAPVKVNSTPLAVSSYDDSTVQQNVVYYYKVTAVAGQSESPQSNMVDIFSPQVNAVVPTNCQLTGNGVRTASVSWEYPDTGLVSSFEILVSEVKDFSLNSVVLQRFPTASQRSYTINTLTPGHAYYWRITTLNPVYKRGRMADDVSAGVPEAPGWGWGPVETVGVGVSPVALIEEGGDLSAAYFSGGENHDVYFGRRATGVWTAGVSALTESLVGGGFSSYMDMVYGAGNHVIFAYAWMPNDLWVEIGSPGSWTTQRVDGDGSIALGHDVSGQYCRGAADDNEYAVIQYHYYAQSTVIQTRLASGGSWTRTVIRTGVTYAPCYDSIAFDAGDLHVLSMDHGGHELLYGTRSGGYALSDIADSGGADIGVSNDLTRVGGAWLTPAQDETNCKLFAIGGDAASWSKDEVISSTDQIGVYARMAPWKSDGAVTVFFAYAAPVRWYFAVLDGGSWTAAQLVMSGVTPGTSMDVACIGDAPYILFEDTVPEPNVVKCAMGTPPPP